jgi:isopropylmalate/homocitrate/citramalate synthase
MKKPLIFDTTLRDGEQMPSVVFKPEEKLELARKFDEFGVNFIDVMPVVSENEKRFVKRLVDENLTAEITATCRAKKEDIDSSLDCNVGRVTVFSSLSDVHLKYVMKTDREENLRKTMESIDYAKSHGLKVDFAGVDSSRADRDYLSDFIEKTSGKIGIFFIADSVGCLTPEKSYSLVKHAKKNSKPLIGLHMHNDFGLATANTLAGLKAGADVFSGTFNGIGPTAGNTPLEEVCVGLKYLYDIDLGLKYEKLDEICRFVEDYSGVKLQKHKPISGEYAFAHEAGVHVAALIKEPSTFENFDPKDIGRKREILLGKQSGRNAVRYVLQKNTENVSDEDVKKTLEKIKILSEHEKRSYSEKEAIELYDSYKNEHSFHKGRFYGNK